MASLNNNNTPLHWSQLAPKDQVRFWNEVDAGNRGAFLTPPAPKKTRRQRGSHSTRSKCEDPEYFRPAHYRKLPGQLGRAYNYLVRFNPVTERPELRVRIAFHPHYVAYRRQAGRKNRFRPEKVSLLNAIWIVLINFCDEGKHTVGMCLSRLAREVSEKDENGNIVPGKEVTVSRVSRLIQEQVRFGTLAVSGKPDWDREHRRRLPKYVWITDLGFRMLGVDPIKLAQQQEKALRRSEERRELIELGLMQEWEELSPHAARVRWMEKMTLQTLRLRRRKAAERKRANRLARLPWDAQVHEMATHLIKTMTPDEAYWCNEERLCELAVQRLHQLDLYMSTEPPTP